MSMSLTSTAFENGGAIPAKYSKEGGNISPPLSWSGVPDGARQLALIMDDPDAPSGIFVHWLLYNVPPGAGKIAEGFSTQALTNGARQGRNGFGEVGYGGPRPPSGTHRYYLHLYAVDTDIELPSGATRAELDRALRGHVLQEAQLMGRYQHRG
jgi:Raf kinase inhibitor-like YbhB/YbcL family protein